MAIEFKNIFKLLSVHMSSFFSKKITYLNPQYVLVVAILTSEFLTIFIIFLACQILWGELPSQKIIIIGTIVSFAVCLPVASIVILLMSKIRQKIQINEELLREIENRKKAEAENSQLESRLNHAQKMEAVGTLAGGIAHDFNNILSIILGYAGMARDDSPKDSAVVKDLDRVLEAGNRAKDLVRQILAFSRHADTEYFPLQLASYVKEATKMLRQILPTTIQINENIDGRIGLIWADPTQIHQIIMNLGTNAFHAMEETGGTLNISLKETSISRATLVREPRVKAGTFVQLSISDSGAGIAPEIKDRIFDPYFTTKGVGKGTGMGLSIVHGIVKSCGGFIAVDSEWGEGTTFHVFLPVMNKEVTIENKVAAQIPVGKERILFIDDEEILVEMGKKMLEKLGYIVTTSNASLKALEIFRNESDRFDLVITDQTMPGITGADLARQMMQIKPGVPIILCTGYSTIMSEEKAKSIGIKEFALKPLVEKDIALLIRKVLDTP
jgi:signal transduction histidine kinase/ActR/RegA family two-component response regulator